MDKNTLDVATLKQLLAAKNYELQEMLKAIERYRKLYSIPVYMKEFDRKVTLDFDDPLYPYCPFRLRKEEIIKYLDNKNEKESK